MRNTRYFLTLLTLILAKAWLYRSLAYGDRNPMSALLLELPALLLGFGLVWLLSPRASRWPLAISYALVSVFLLGSAGYVVYFNTLVTPAIFSFTRQLGTLQATVVELWGPAYLLFLIDLPVVLYFAARPRRQPEPAPTGTAPLPDASAEAGSGSAAPVSRTLLVVATVLAGLVLATQVGFALRLPAAVDTTLVARAHGTAPAQLATGLRPKSDSLAQAAVAAAASADSGDTTSAPEPPADETPAERLVRLINEARGPLSGARLVGFDRGAYKGAPIILVQIEALQTMDVGTKVDGHAVTPNLTAFADRSYYFPNMIPQLSRGNTSDVEWAVNSGMNPPVGSAACLEYAGKTVPALPRLLSDQQGYAAFTAHANDAAYWNRSRLYPALGFDTYYDKKYFGRADAMWSGVSDEVFFRKSLGLIKTANADNKPYYANLITLSSHQPYVYVPAARRPLKLASAQAETTVGRHLGAISYTDKAFGEFVAGLDDAGILDRAIVVVIGDHWAIQAKDVNSDASRALIRQLLGRDYTAADKLKVPLMIHLPGQPVGVRSEATVGEVDIAPTLADATALDVSEVPMVGRSVFERHTRLAQTRTGAPGGSFANNRVLYLAGLDFNDGTAISVADGSRATLMPADEVDFARSAALTALGDEWLRLLPDRSTAGDDDAAAVIPTRK